MRTDALDIKTTIRGTVPRIPFSAIAAFVLPRYQLSLVLCGDDLAKRINITYRKKSYSPNVLSFPLDKNEGEIFLNVRKAEREALPAGRQGGKMSVAQKRIAVRNRVALLFVHGLFHLKGLDHGDKMESEEERVLRRFKLA